jgi:hypothetical protein
MNEVPKSVDDTINRIINEAQKESGILLPSKERYSLYCQMLGMFKTDGIIPQIKLSQGEK